MWWLIMWIIVFVVLIGGGITGFLPGGALVVGIAWLLFSVAAFLLVWFVLAPRNYFFTFVQEGTAKIVVRGDAFAKALIQWRDHTFDDEWNVVEGTEPWHPFGGLRFYGLWPIWDIFGYTLRWHDLQRTGGGQFETPVFHEEVLDYVLLRPDVYWTKLPRAETGGEERIPIDAEFLTTMQVVNPYKVIFVAPIGWVENALLRLAPVYRGLVASQTIDALLALRGRGDEISAILTGAGAFNLIRDVLENEWGVKTAERGIQIKDIDLPSDYQAAAAARRRQELESAGRAAEAVGMVISMMAQSRGKSEGEIKTEINASDEMRREFLDLAKDLVVRKLGIEGKSYLDIRVQGAEGFERVILNALATWQKIPGEKRGGE